MSADDARPGIGGMRNYYRDLGVSPTASRDAIERRYRALSKKHHPNWGGDADKFSRLSRAYKVLTDRLARDVYDEAQRELGEVNLTFGLSALVNFAGATALGLYGAWVFLRAVRARVWRPG